MITDGSRRFSRGNRPWHPFGTVYQSAECQQVKPLTALNYASLPAVMSLRVVSMSRDRCVPGFLGASLRRIPACL
jgi:hypothetical protein